MIFATINDHGYLTKLTAETYKDLYNAIMELGWVDINLEQAIEDFDAEVARCYENPYEYAIAEYCNMYIPYAKMTEEVSSEYPYLMDIEGQIEGIKDILDISCLFNDWDIPDFVKTNIRLGILSPLLLDLEIQRATSEEVWIYINPAYDFEKEEN